MRLTCLLILVVVMLGASCALAQTSRTYNVSDYPVVYQSVIDDTITKDGNIQIRSILYYGVAGFPFPASTLKLDSSITIYQTTIDIDSIDAEGNIFFPNMKSAVPVQYGLDERGSPFMSLFTRAINVTWRFSKAGMIFSADSNRFKTTRSGATISFTKAGVKLDGVVKAPSTVKKPH